MIPSSSSSGKKPNTNIKSKLIKKRPITEVSSSSSSSPIGARVMPKIVKTVDIDDPTKRGLSSTPKRYVLEGLTLGDPSYAYEQIAKMLKEKRPQLVELFDEFHRFTRLVEGGCHVKEGTFWKVQPLHGHEHLRNMVHRALVERLTSIPLQDVPYIDISTQDIIAWLTANAEQNGLMLAYIKSEGSSEEPITLGATPANTDLATVYRGDWLRAVHAYIKYENDKLDAEAQGETKNEYRFVIERKDEVGPWLDPLKPKTLASFASEMMAHVHIRHLTKSIIKQPTALSVERWINTEATKRRVFRIERQFNNKFSDDDSTTNALKEAVHPSLFVAFEKAFVFAKQKYPGISITNIQFIGLIKDIKFVNLVCSFYNQSKLMASTLSSQRNKRDARVSTSLEIQEFLDAPPMHVPSRSIFSTGSDDDDDDNDSLTINNNIRMSYSYSPLQSTFSGSSGSLSFPTAQRVQSKILY